MSQLPTSLTESGRPPSNGELRAAAAARPIPRLGIGSLNVVPIHTLPAVPNRNAQVMREALQMIQGLGNTASKLGNEFDRKRAENDALASRALSQYAGQARLDAESALPGLLQKIQNREMLVPNGVPVENYVRDLLGEELEALKHAEDGTAMPEKAAEVYGQVYRNSVQPRLIAAFIDQQQAIIDGNADEMDLRFREAAYIASTPAELADILSQRQTLRPNDTMSQHLDAVIVPALEQAANTGNPELFDTAKQALGGRFFAVQDQLEQRLESNMRAKQGVSDRAALDAADERMAALYNQVSERGGTINREAFAETIATVAASDEQRRSMLDELERRVAVQARTNEQNADEQMLTLFNNRAPVPQQRRALESLRPELGEQRTDEHRRRIDAQEAAEQREIERRIVTQAETEQTSRALQNAGGLLLQGQGTAIEDIPITNPVTNETIRTISRDDLIQQNVATAMQRFAEAAPDEQTALALQVEYLSRNGVRYEQWQRKLSAGWLGSAANIIGEGKAVPTGTLKSYRLWKQLGTQNQRLRDEHIDSADADQFYRNASLAETWIVPGDEAAALAIAARAHANRNEVGGKASRVNDGRLAAAVSNLESHWSDWLPGLSSPTARLKNAAEMQGLAEQIARLHVEDTGVHEAAAVNAAAKSIAGSYTIVNNWAVLTRGQGLPQDLQQNFSKINNEVARWYVRNYGEDEGVSVDDLVFIPGAEVGTWRLYNASAERVVEHWREAGVGVLTTKDLQDLYLETIRENDEARNQEIVDKAAQRQRHRALTAKIFLSPPF